VLDDASQVITALVRYHDVFDPRTTSVLTVSGGTRSVGGEPFRGQLIGGFEQRVELVRRLRRLSHRERALLYLWYVESLPVVKIAKRLGVSRVHCYRLRRRALEAMTLGGGPEDPREAGSRTGVGVRDGVGLRRLA
jgi:DNA-directed RNA polymerase specialized sigma24 family protein